jgi:hypothetical protein
VNLVTRKTKDLKMLGGCKGYVVDKNNVYRPHFSLAIVEKI